jgi:hypothetical protein
MPALLTPLQRNKHDDNGEADGGCNRTCELLGRSTLLLLDTTFRAKLLHLVAT